MPRKKSKGSKKSVDLCPKCEKKDKQTINDEIDDKIQCEWCDKWFHHSCVGLSDDVAATIDAWYDSDCMEQESALEITYKNGNGDESSNRNEQAEPGKLEVASTVNFKALSVKDRLGWFSFTNWLDQMNAQFGPEVFEKVAKTNSNAAAVIGGSALCAEDAEKVRRLLETAAKEQREHRLSFWHCCFCKTPNAKGLATCQCCAAVKVLSVWQFGPSCSAHEEAKEQVDLQSCYWVRSHFTTEHANLLAGTFSFLSSDDSQLCLDAFEPMRDRESFKRAALILCQLHGDRKQTDVEAVLEATWACVCQHQNFGIALECVVCKVDKPQTPQTSVPEYAAGLNQGTATGSSQLLRSVGCETKFLKPVKLSTEPLLELPKFHFNQKVKPQTNTYNPIPHSQLESHPKAIQNFESLVVAKGNTKKRLAEIALGSEDNPQTKRIAILPTIDDNEPLNVNDIVWVYLGDKTVRAKITRFREATGRDGPRASIFVEPLKGAPKLDKFKPAYIYKDSICKKYDPTGFFGLSRMGVETPPASPQAFTPLDPLELDASEPKDQDAMEVSMFDLMNAPLYGEVDGELQLMTNETEAPINESVNIPSDQTDDIQEVDIEEVAIQEVAIQEVAIQEVENLQAEFAATTIEQVGDDVTEADPLVEATLETVANFAEVQLEQFLAKLGSTLGTSRTTNRLASPGREPLPARLTSPDHPTSSGREASPARLVSAGQVASHAKTSKNTKTGKSAKRSKTTKTPLVEGELSEHSWTKARKRAQEGLRAMKVGKGPAKGGSPQVPLEEIWKQVDEAHTLPESYPTTSRRGDKPSLGNFDCRFCEYSLTTPTGHRQHEESHFFRYQCDDENCNYKDPEHDGVPALYNNKNSLGLHLGNCDGSVAGAILWKYSLPTKHTRQNQEN